MGGTARNGPGDAGDAAAVWAVACAWLLALAVLLAAGPGCAGVPVLGPVADALSGGRPAPGPRIKIDGDHNQVLIASGKRATAADDAGGSVSSKGKHVGARTGKVPGFAAEVPGFEAEVPGFEPGLDLPPAAPPEPDEPETKDEE